MATADGVYAAVAALGGAGLAGIIAPVAGPLRVVAAAVLFGLAGHGLWRTGPRTARGGRRRPPGRGMSTPGRAYAALLGLTLLNPMTVLYFSALVLGRRDTAGSGPAAVALFVAGVFLASASWQLVVAGGGTMVGRALTGPSGRLITGWCPARSSPRWRWSRCCRAEGGRWPPGRAWLDAARGPRGLACRTVGR